MRSVRPGYRVYYLQRGAQTVVLLCGGDERTQRRDIKRAVMRISYATPSGSLHVRTVWAKIAGIAGLNRESLYKALGETGNPELSTVMRIVRALGLTLSARPRATGRTSKRRRVA
jgi:hypothetical protein